jgi:hypothetical protein
MDRTAAPVTPDATATIRSIAAFPGDHLGDQVTNLAGNLNICKMPEKLRGIDGKDADGHHFNTDEIGQYMTQNKQKLNGS